MQARRHVTTTLFDVRPGPAALTPVDCFRTPLLPGDDRDPLAWVRAVFGSPPSWVRVLMAVRRVVVAPFGLVRTTGSEWEAPFPVISRTPDELVLGLDDRHLDFRLHVASCDDYMAVTTSVRLHNRLGRCYWALVGRIHPHVVRAALRRTPTPVPPVDPQASATGGRPAT